jgi:hypothetical protein
LAILGAVIGERLEYFMDADGRVKTVEGMNELTDHVAVVGTPQQRQLFNALFGGDQLKNEISSGDWMPNRIVKVGESWSVTKDSADPIGMLTVSMKYTFKNWEQHGDRKCAHIEGTGNISSKSVSTASGTMVKIEKAKLSEEFWFDPNPGTIVGGNENEDVTLKITTRTQTATKEQHNKIQWTLADAQ